MRVLVVIASVATYESFRLNSKRSELNTSTIQPHWATLAQRARDLRDCYRNGYEFPSWSIDKLGSGALRKYMKTTEYYYSHGADLETVKQLSLQREPVNIAMQRAYNSTRLQKQFGWEVGAYARSSKQRLMPNIAAYSTLPFDKKDVHLVNVIMSAFDSTNQPDYKYFFDESSGQVAKWDELVARTSETFRFMFAIARRKKLKRVIAPYHYHRRRFFHELLDKDSGDVEALMKGKQLTDKAFKVAHAEFSDIEYVPMKSKDPRLIFEKDARDLWNKKIKFNPKQDLLVNSWDPWSIVGNGNCPDSSTDGIYGCLTPVAVLSWPRTNPYIDDKKYVAVDPPEKKLVLAAPHAPNADAAYLEAKKGSFERMQQFISSSPKQVQYKSPRSGWTCLHQAALYRNYSSALWLIEHGADMNAVGKSDETAYDVWTRTYTSRKPSAYSRRKWRSLLGA